MGNLKDFKFSVSCLRGTCNDVRNLQKFYQNASNRKNFRKLLLNFWNYNVTSILQFAVEFTKFKNLILGSWINVGRLYGRYELEVANGIIYLSFFSFMMGL